MQDVAHGCMALISERSPRGWRRRRRGAARRPVIEGFDGNLRTRKIVLTTIGTLGDLHPFIAIALALKARGFRPVLAVPEDHVAKVQRAGLEAVAVLPGFDTIRERLGVSESEAVRRMMSDQRYMLEQAVLPSLSACAHTLDALAADADAIVASTMVLAAPIVAEKRGLPLVSVMLQPMAMASALDPPKTPDFWMMRQRPASKVGERWNLLMYAAFRQILHRLYADQLDIVRIEHGLRPRGALRMLEAGREALLTIGCYSAAFAPLPRDAPRNARVVGFPIFDSEDGGSSRSTPALEAFLKSRTAADRLHARVVRGLCRGRFLSRGRRGRAAAGTARDPADRRARDDRDEQRHLRVRLCPALAPVPPLRRAGASWRHRHHRPGAARRQAATGRAAHGRSERQRPPPSRAPGSGGVLKAKHFSARRATAVMEDLLRDPARRERAARIGETIAQENGAQAAARAIEQALGQGKRHLAGQPAPLAYPRLIVPADRRCVIGSGGATTRRLRRSATDTAAGRIDWRISTTT